MQRPNKIKGVKIAVIILIVGFCSAIPAIIFGIIFKNANLQSGLTLFIWIGTIIITGAIFALFIKKFIKKKTNNAV